MPADRRLLLLPHAASHVADWLLNAFGPAASAQVLWVAEQAPSPFVATLANKVASHLGGECDMLVVDACQGFHPDAFAAAAGTLRGGGDCLLITPPLERWAAFADPDKRRFAAYPRDIGEMRGLFIQRLLAFVVDHPAVVQVHDLDRQAPRLAPARDEVIVLNRDQQHLVERVERVARGHARRPLVVTADRGRGKSTALGVAAAQLLLSGYPHVTVIAPHRRAVDTLFRHAARLADRPVDKVDDLSIGDGSLRLRLPTEWLAMQGDNDGLVIVDEAAAIPVALLNDVIERANRLVFASTVHGYEGSGRGFDLRFRRQLDRQFRQVQDVRLSHPVRWRDADALEALVDDLLLLNVDLAAAPSSGDVVVSRLDIDALAGDEQALRALFGLLVNAHYQTRPSDLRQLLDNSDVHLWAASRDAQVVGVVMAVEEGGFDATLSHAIMRGQRRPRGHLLPQSLAVHAGLDAFLGLRLLRVQRIAVHPELRRHRVATRLLNAVADWAALNDFAAIGCAHSIELPLLRFWQSAGFQAVRLGTRIDPAAAAPSVFMLRGVGEAGESPVASAAFHFRQDLPWTLGGAQASLDPDVAVELLRSRDCGDMTLTVHDLRELERVASGVRGITTADALIWRAVVVLCAQAADACDLPLAVAAILQRCAIPLLRRRFSVDGAGQLEQRLRSLLSAGLPLLQSEVDARSPAP